MTEQDIGWRIAFDAAYSTGAYGKDESIQLANGKYPKATKKLSRLTKLTPEDFQNAKLTETTTTGSVGGSYETPFGVSSDSELQMLNNLKENNQSMNITVTEIAALVKTTLIKEEVYSQEPKLDNTAYGKEAEGKAKETSTKNAKKQAKYDSPAGKNTDSNAVKSGKHSKASNKESIKKVGDSLKNNLENSEVMDVNKDKVQDEDQRIEANANGLEDTQYDNISPEKQKQNTEYIKNESSMDSPNSQDTGINQQIVDDAKKRVDARNNDDANYRFFGDDVTPKAKGEKGGETKKIAYEGKVTQLKFGKLFESDKDMLTRVKKLPAKYKSNNNLVEMKDGENTYLIRWEGHSSTGIAVILEHNNTKQHESEYKHHMMLSEYKTQENNTKSSEDNVHDVFKQMMNESRDIFTRE